ncbi:hypothetical protein MUP01_09655 [Candidatus Bathyarchaeota archaeon]|jgi:hypothetical protein|nr:hypothetical protein [Candidatus Bathyarchaeota archaeon]
MEEKPTAAFALSLVGGILELLLGIAIAGVTGAIFAFIGLEALGLVFGAYWIILGIIILLGAIMLYNNPASTHTWGIVILILSIISGLNIFALIGGILAMVWKPSTTTRSAAPPPPP